MKALWAIKSSLIDPCGNLSDWDQGDPCTSNWTGVFCYNTTLDDGYLHVQRLYEFNLSWFLFLSESIIDMNIVAYFRTIFSYFVSFVPLTWWDVNYSTFISTHLWVQQGKTFLNYVVHLRLKDIYWARIYYPRISQWLLASPNGFKIYLRDLFIC